VAERRIELRVYLEGVHIPVQSVNIMTRGNIYSTCEITLPPHREMLNIPPRTYVQVFFRDFFENTGDFKQDFRLLWDGEVRGRAFAKTPDGRHFSLSCVDLTNYWSSIPGFLRPGALQGFDQVLGALMYGGTDANTESHFRSGGDTFDSQVSAILESDPEEGVGKAIQDFLERALSLNVFFRIQNLRRKIVPLSVTTRPDPDTEIDEVVVPQGRIKVVPDPESLSLFRANKINDIFTYALKAIDSSVDFRVIVNRFMEFFFYHGWTLPAPAKVDNTLVQMVFKPSTFFSAPPACNVLWPDDYYQIDQKQDFLSEPTRLRLRPLPGSVISDSLFAGDSVTYKFDVFAPKILGDIAWRTHIGQSGQLPSILKEGDAPPIDPETQASPAVGGFSRITIPPEYDSVILSDRELATDLDLRRNEPNNVPYVLILKGGVPDESREDLKGAILEEIPLTHFAWLAGKEAGGASVGEYIGRMAEYYLFLRQHERPVSVQGPFNPYVVPGLPAVVLSRPFPIFGDISGLSHTINSDGTASTSLAMGYSRSEDAVRFVHQEEIEAVRDATLLNVLNELIRTGSDQEVFVATQLKRQLVSRSSLEPARDVPPWINAAYRPEFVGKESFKARNLVTDQSVSAETSEENTLGLVLESVSAFRARSADREGAYPALLGKGVTSIFRDGLPDPAQGNKLIDPEVDLKYNQLEAADLLLRIYDAREGIGRQRFTDSFRQRPVATLEEVVEFVEGEIINENEFGSGLDLVTLQSSRVVELPTTTAAGAVLISLQGIQPPPTLVFKDPSALYLTSGVVSGSIVRVTDVRGSLEFDQVERRGEIVSNGFVDFAVDSVQSETELTLVGSAGFTRPPSGVEYSVIGTDVRRAPFKPEVQAIMRTIRAALLPGAHVGGV
jgi:hypothetical protein